MFYNTLENLFEGGLVYLNTCQGSNTKSNPHMVIWMSKQCLVPLRETHTRFHNSWTGVWNVRLGNIVHNGEGKVLFSLLPPPPFSLALQTLSVVNQTSGIRGRQLQFFSEDCFPKQTILLFATSRSLVRARSNRRKEDSGCSGHGSHNGTFREERQEDWKEVSNDDQWQATPSSEWENRTNLYPLKEFNHFSISLSKINQHFSI